MDILSNGYEAETRAYHFLERQGLKLLARNYRCKMGEIDLIMQDNQDIVFIEVRSRRNALFADAIESININKQRKLIKTAVFYLQKNRWFDKVQCRFDIIGMTGNDVHWIKDAFSADILY